MKDWVTLGEYLDKDVLIQTEAVLNTHEIAFRLISPENHLNSGFGQATDQPFIIEVASDQFELAKSLILNEDEDSATAEMSLDEYSLEELKEIVLNPEDWHEQFIARAEEELSKRGATVSQQANQNLVH